MVAKQTPGPDSATVTGILQEPRARIATGQQVNAPGVDVDSLCPVELRRTPGAIGELMSYREPNIFAQRS